MVDVIDGGANPMAMLGLDGVNPAVLQGLFGDGGKKWERVIYYRNPARNFLGEVHLEANWISWSDSQTLKRADRMLLGYMPLELFGAIHDSKHPWEGILAHPQGAGMFPVDQILSYKWYDIANLKRDWLGCPANVTSPAQVFGQLRGVPIELFTCPNCRNREFTNSGGLFSHMHNTHDMAPSDIFAYFEHEGIEFKMRRAERSHRVITFDDVPEIAPEPAPEPLAITRRGKLAEEPVPV